jgi:hypothetical protein
VLDQFPVREILLFTLNQLSLVMIPA